MSYSQIVEFNTESFTRIIKCEAAIMLCSKQIQECKEWRENKHRITRLYYYVL